MAIDETLKPGAILTYPYLWKWQVERGETEGRKSRPTCVIIALLGKDGLTHLALLAISSQSPREGQLAIEIPEFERRRAGLSDWKQAWVTVSEYNYDIAEQSYYYDPNLPPIGRFSKQFMQKLAVDAAPLFQKSDARVNRTE